MRISDWSSDVCSSDLLALLARALGGRKCVHAHVLFLHTDEVMDLVDQSTDLRAVLEFPDIVQFVEAQRLDRQAVLRLRAAQALDQAHLDGARSEEHTSELQSLMRISYAVFCLNNKKK